MDGQPWRKRRLRGMLRIAEKDLSVVLKEPRFQSPRFCRTYLDWCTDNAFDRPDSAISRATTGLALAKLIGDRHLISKAYGLLSTGYRVNGNTTKSLSILDDAESRAKGCPCCLADLIRRRGIAVQHSSEMAKSVMLFKRSIGYFEEVSDTDGIARVKVSRGISFFHLGDIDAALQDENDALEGLSTDSPKIFHTAAVVNIAGFLALGNSEHFAQAVDYLDSFRSRLKGVPDFTFVRIRIRWIEGLVMARLGQVNRAIRKLENVRRALVKLRQDSDVVAVSADLAALYHEKSDFDSISLLAKTCLRVVGTTSKAASVLRSLAEAATENIAVIPTTTTALRFSVPSSVPSLLGPATAPGPLIAGSDT